MRFYDDLADYYELIFPDGESSMARQGAAISALLVEHGRRSGPAGFRVLDAAAGIGTQALPLAAAGFEVTARDLSERAVARLRREAAGRGLHIDAARADMRNVAESVRGPFDAVICCDNSVPHLLTDSDIREAFAEFREVLAEDGLLLLSMRDYDQVDRSPQPVHPYGERTRGSERFRLRQEMDMAGRHAVPDDVRRRAARRRHVGGSRPYQRRVLRDPGRSTARAHERGGLRRARRHQRAVLPADPHGEIRTMVITEAGVRAVESR